jgi:hypothetical protein
VRTSAPAFAGEPVEARELDDHERAGVSRRDREYAAPSRCPRGKDIDERTDVMTGKKQQIKSKDKADAENAKVQMQDFHITKLTSPRDVSTGLAKS